MPDDHPIVELYHGTTQDALPSILAEGLRPDIDHAWKDSDDFVYLTGNLDMAWEHARRTASKTGSKPVIIIINTTGLIIETYPLSHPDLQCYRYDGIIQPDRIVM